ncbi:MAG: hypothetical protein ACRDOV_08840 [Streptomyces sp.]
MPAEEREQQHGTPGRSASAVSMRELLASCAAADAVSKPPSDEAEGVERAVGRGGPGTVPGRPEHDAA